MLSTIRACIINSLILIYYMQAKGGKKTFYYFYIPFLLHPYQFLLKEIIKRKKIQSIPEVFAVKSTASGLKGTFLKPIYNKGL